jgi:hypothetical protein
VAIAIVPGLILLFFSFIFGNKIINILPLGTILNNEASVFESFLIKFKWQISFLKKIGNF